MSTAESAATGEVARDPAPSPARGVRVDVPQTENEQRRVLAAVQAVIDSERAAWVASVNEYEGSDAVASHAGAVFDVLDRVERAISAPSVQTGEQP